MAQSAQERLDCFMTGLIRRNPGEREFHQAIHEVAASVFPYIQNRPIYHEMRIMERMAEPDRIISFRVCWQDDSGNNGTLNFSSGYASPTRVLNGDIYPVILHSDFSCTLCVAAKSARKRSSFGKH